MQLSIVVGACPLRRNTRRAHSRVLLTIYWFASESLFFFIALFYFVSAVDPGDPRAVQRDLHATKRRRGDQVGAPRFCSGVSARVGRLSTGRRFRRGEARSPSLPLSLLSVC